MYGTETEEERQRREAEAAALAPPQLAAPLVKSTRTGNTTTSRTVYGPGNAKAEAEVVESQKAAAPLALMSGELDAQKMEGAAQAADLKEHVQAQHEQRRAEIDAKFNAEMEARRADHAEKVKRHAETGIKGYWDDKSNGQKVTAGIAMLIGGFGVGLARAAGNYGTKNGAAEVIDNAIERDYRAQLAKIEKMKDEIQLASGRVVDVRQRKAAALDELEAWKAGKYEGVATYAEKVAAKVGTEQARVNAEKLANEARQKSAESALKMQDRHAKQVQSTVTQHTTQVDPQYALGGAAKPLTNPQADAAGSLGLLASNLEKIRELRKGGVSITPDLAQKYQDQLSGFEAANKSASNSITGYLGTKALRAVDGVVGSSLAPRDALKGFSPEQKALFQANDQVRQQIVKIMTGAGITNAEQEASRLAFLPGPFDSPADTENKIQMAVQYVKELSIKAGPAAGGLIQRAENIAKPPAQPQAPTVKEERTLKSGKRIRVYSDDTFEYIK